MDKVKNPQVVILCGGFGTRLRDYVDPVPKALVPIGQMPIIWHVMKIYSHYGFKDFVLCLGYKGDSIKRYFLEFELMANDFTLNLRSKRERIISHNTNPENWNITFVDTGLNSLTAKRIKSIEKYILADNFLCTYADGLTNANINKIYEFHLKKNKIATLLGVQPTSPFGVITEEDGIATSFREKPRLSGLTNGGFFCFNRKIFEYLTKDEFLEYGPLHRLSEEKQLSVYKHEDFWMPMDTVKDVERLNQMWAEGNRPWVVWR